MATNRTANAPWVNLERLYRDVYTKLNAFTDLKFQFREEGLDSLINDFQRVRDLLTTNLDDLAVAAAIVMQQETLQRGNRLQLPMYHTAKNVYAPSDTLRVGLNLVLDEIAKPVTKLGKGAAAFARRSDLDKIRLQELRSLRAVKHDLTDEEMSADTGISALRGNQATTEFDRVWMIVEFGTGIFAYPGTKRLEGPTKDKGGAWWLLPTHQKFDHWGWRKHEATPLILGQKPTHFLLGRRADSRMFREEGDRIRSFVREVLLRILAGEKFNFKNLT